MQLVINVAEVVSCHRLMLSRLTSVSILFLSFYISQQTDRDSLHIVYQGQDILSSVVDDIFQENREKTFYLMHLSTC